MERKEKVTKNPILQDDILRYKKNKFAGNFALLALVFNCLYFILLYAIHTTEMYTVVVGVSVIINLIVLLAGFFASEGIKGYNKKFCILLFILAAVQIIRIFIYPTMGMAKGWLKDNFFFGIKMTTASNGIVMILFLGVSAACFILSGVYGFIIAKRLENFTKKVENGEVSVEKTMAELDAQDDEKASAAQDKILVTEVETVTSEEVDNG